MCLCLCVCVCGKGMYGGNNMQLPPQPKVARSEGGEGIYMQTGDGNYIE